MAVIAYRFAIVWGGDMDCRNGGGGVFGGHGWERTEREAGTVWGEMMRERRREIESEDGGSDHSPKSLFGRVGPHLGWRSGSLLAQDGDDLGRLLSSSLSAECSIPQIRTSRANSSSSCTSWPIRDGNSLKHLLFHQPLFIYISLKRRLTRSQKSLFPTVSPSLQPKISENPPRIYLAI